MKFKIHGMSLSQYSKYHEMTSVQYDDGGSSLFLLCFFKQIFYSRNHAHQLCAATLLLTEASTPFGRRPTLPTFSSDFGQQILNELVAHGSWSQHANSVAGRAAERSRKDTWSSVFIAAIIKFHIQIDRWKNQWGWQSVL